MKGCEESTKAHVESIETVVQRQWITLEEVHYVDRQGCKRVWERCARTSPQTRAQLQQDATLSREIKSVPGSVSHDSTASTLLKASSTIIIPLTLHSRSLSKTPQAFPRDFSILLIKQFRPAVGAYTVEFPAGLIDINEDPSETAKRELKEETGYVAQQLVAISPLLSLSPGMASECCYTYIATIDLDHPENKNVQQCLDEEEDIQVLHVSLESVAEKLKAYADEGLVIFDGVYNFAVGLTILPQLLKEGVLGLGNTV